MKFGAGLPQLARDAPPDRYRTFAETVEGLGFHSVIAPDHVVGGPPDAGGYYTAADPLHEPLTLLASIAATTEELRLITSILILPQRQTALVAKQAAEVDWLSDGRLRLGVGVGWNELEFAVLDQPFHTRGRRIEAQVNVLRRFWEDDLVEVEDEWHTIPGAGINPRPARAPIPIWMGGGSDPVLRRIARQADGWAMPGVGMEKLRALRDRLGGYVAAEGRELGDLALLGRMTVGESDPAAWVEAARAWVDFGATHVLVTARGADVDPLDRLGELMAAIDDSDVTAEA